MRGRWQHRWSPLLDIDGEPRIGEPRVDIGCDEFYDVDNDTLPDWWERLYFADATAGTPGEDLDQDGPDKPPGTCPTEKPT